MVIVIKSFITCPHCQREIMVGAEEGRSVEEYISNFTCPYCKVIILKKEH